MLRHEGQQSSKLEALADCPNMPDPSPLMGSAAHPNEQKLLPFLRTPEMGPKSTPV